MNDTLKPCPFCGGISLRIDDSDEVFRYVVCFDCSAQGPSTGTEDDDSEFGSDYAAAAERDAIEAWNSRSPAQRAARGGRAKK